VKLIAKINLVFLAAFVLALALIGTVTHALLQGNAREEVLADAAIMMEAALAIRTYTVEEIRPLIQPQMEETFLPQSVPSYAATQNFQSLRQAHPEYIYKEATLNPTNPRDRATDWEADIIQQFRNNRGLGEIVGERDTPTGRSLYLARPIAVTDSGCLVCHSTPDAAPGPMIALYGDANGFGWQLDEVVGSQVVSVPLEVALSKANGTWLIFMGALTVTFAALFVLLNVLLRFLIFRPLDRIAGKADRISRGEMDVPEFEFRGNDEIASVGKSFNRMHRSLAKTLDMLQP
jgi:protein-histidine pros-kinase